MSISYYAVAVRCGVQPSSWLLEMNPLERTSSSNSRVPLASPVAALAIALAQGGKIANGVGDFHGSMYSRGNASTGLVAKERVEVKLLRIDLCGRDEPRRGCSSMRLQYPAKRFGHAFFATRQIFSRLFLGKTE